VSAVRVNASVAIVMVGLPVREGLLVEGDLLGGRVRPGEPGEGSDGLGKYYRQCQGAHRCGPQAPDIEEVLQ
jgi:hypothetical protein